MSFPMSAPRLASAFELLSRSLLQPGEGLPFAQALTSQQMRRAFDDEGVSFGRNQAESDGDIVYTPAITLWAMLSQMVFTGEERSCRAAVVRVAAYHALRGRTIAATNTGAYCRARRKVTEGVVRRLTQQVARGCDEHVPHAWLWNGRTVRLVDGTTVSMPDTPQNQAAYPQPAVQAPGVGFPLMRVVALTSLATGMVTAAASGPYAGKETGETALFRTLFEELSAGDVVLADRYYSGWFMLALLQERGVDFVVRMHQLRDADFSKGRPLGKDDALVSWPKPAKPNWIDQATYDRLPPQIDVRLVRVNVAVAGFRVKSLVVVTSLGDAKACSREDLAALYRRRWTVELQLRDIKSAMRLDVLRCKTPAAVRQEFWTGLLAYNLIRRSMLQSAQRNGDRPETLSFTAAQQLLANAWLVAAVPAPEAHGPSPWTALLLAHGRSHRVGNRPNRVEPRAIKRRPKPHDLLKIPRATARARLLANPIATP